MAPAPDVPISETTPLLVNHTSYLPPRAPSPPVVDVKSYEDGDDSVYDRFSRGEKRTILTIISCSVLLTLFTSCSFTPVIPQIAEDLQTTGSIINFSVGLFICTAAFGSLFWARYSGYYGRQPIYIVSLPIYILASFGVSFSHSVPTLLLFRALQAFGSCAFQSVGAGTISDIYRLEERGRAMGVYYCLALLGPAIAPFIGGLVAHHISWRIMQISLGIVGLIDLFCVITFLPETTHPGKRGIDRMGEVDEKRGSVVLLNPFKALGLMKSPVLLLITLAMSTMMITDFVIMLPIAYTIGQRYGITNKALIGALFLPDGLGNMIGAPLSGILSDRTLSRLRRTRPPGLGSWIPEDRLHSTLPSALLIVPLTTLLLGLSIQYIDDVMWGVVVAVVLLGVHGVGMLLVAGPGATYCVDIMRERSAEVIAANYALRSFITSITILGILPAIETFGVVWTNGIAAALSWIGFGLIWIVIRYGGPLRGWSSVRHTDGSP
ncbi:MFS general substrate transporter [Sistotremastrum niveocremeum HHB9708]|uniref:MFS general substrate transporter n=1 Tax=Sistotremastrum niveocremeum HHB9708 TaxID=1314777 RepID=A0A164QNC9_9AGAM|nr:MFS general substrate transporter [Sistotremastrum niveocremeum HHB9708]